MENLKEDFNYILTPQYKFVVDENNQITWIDICDQNTSEEYKFDSYVEAEVQLIILQRKYKQ